MDKQPHLLVCISAHGFGHIAQTAPVLNTLHERLPGLRVTVRTMSSFAQLRARIKGPFNHLCEGGDLGMAMVSALEVQPQETIAAYQRIHYDWELAVSREASSLREIAPDFVLSNVSYLPLAGAHRAGIPCAAMCSLNWADIFTHYCGNASGSHHILEQMQCSYAHADAFLQIAPHMPMHNLNNRIAFGPVAAIGCNRRPEIDAIFGLDGNEKLVLVSLGGFDSRLPTEIWPRIPGVHWIIPASWRSTHPDALTLEALKMHFGDVLASCDTLICKPGYGSFVEAACSGVPVLYVARDDWPETHCLEQWLANNGRTRKITRERMERGEFIDELSDLLTAAPMEAAIPSGVEEVADWLAKYLRRE